MFIHQLDHGYYSLNGIGFWLILKRHIKLWLAENGRIMAIGNSNPNLLLPKDGLTASWRRAKKNKNGMSSRHIAKGSHSETPSDSNQVPR